jgi:hypothetical protein
MTKAEALKEARRRWGHKGRAWVGARSSPLARYRVGYYYNPAVSSSRICGAGKSWEAAFIDADNEGNIPFSLEGGAATGGQET